MGGRKRLDSVSDLALHYKLSRTAGLLCAGGRGHAAWCLAGCAHGLCMAPCVAQGDHPRTCIPLLGSQGTKPSLPPDQAQPKSNPQRQSTHRPSTQASSSSLQPWVSWAGQGPSRVWGGLRTLDSSLSPPSDLPGALSLHPANMDHTKVPAPPWGTHMAGPQGSSDGP